jgi:hypothetical protein
MQIIKEKNALLAPYNKMIFNCGTVLQLLPLVGQESLFNQQIGNARLVRNHYRTKREEMYKSPKITLTYLRIRSGTCTSGL